MSSWVDQEILADPPAAGGNGNGRWRLKGSPQKLTIFEDLSAGGNGRWRPEGSPQKLTIFEDLSAKPLILGHI